MGLGSKESSGESLAILKYPADSSESGRQYEAQKATSKQIQYPCPYAEETGCSQLFTQSSSATRHARKKHGGKIPCPNTQETGCKELFNSSAAAICHATRKHNGTTYPCPAAKEKGCTKSFSSQINAYRHVNTQHHKIAYPCPAAEETGCTRTFWSTIGVSNHMNAEHHKLRFPCPKAEETGCQKTFFSRLDARRHSDSIHNGVKYPCPSAKETGCTRIYSAASNAYNHAEIAHNEKFVPCPLAKSSKCTQRFPSNWHAKDHAASVHSDKTFLCPMAEKTGCTKTFKTKRKAKLHIDSIHLSKEYSCSDCQKSFSSYHRLNSHQAKAHRGWICAVPLCRYAVSRLPMTKPYIDKHMARHKELGQLDGLDPCPQPTRARDDDMPPESADERPNSGDIAVGNEDEGNDNDEEDDKDDDDDDDESDDSDEADYSESLSLAEDGCGKNHNLSDDLLFTVEIMEDDAAIEEAVMARNEKLRKEYPHIRHINLGRHCIGSSLINDGMVTKVCPRDTIIRYNTSPLHRDGKHLVLPGRCTLCYAEYQFNQYIRRFDLAGVAGQVVCDDDRCVEPIWRGTRFCKTHFSRAAPTDSTKTSEEMSALRLLLRKATSSQWEQSAQVRQALKIHDAILKGQMPSSMLRFLDLEYNCQTGRVHEVGMCDAAGNLTMDFLTRLSPAELERTSSNSKASNMYKALNESKAIQAIRHQKAIANHHCRQGSLDVHQFARQLKEEDVSPNTIFIVWATNKSDLRCLRHWLEAEGYKGILPPDSHCITLTHAFQHNLRICKSSNGKLFPTSLPTIFPLFFGTGHHLYGRNHHAPVDTLQLWLMFQAFKQLCLPLSDPKRDWQILGGAGNQQKNLEDYWPKTIERKGNKKLHSAEEDGILDDRQGSEEPAADTSDLQQAVKKRRRV